MRLTASATSIGMSFTLRPVDITRVQRLTQTLPSPLAMGKDNATIARDHFIGPHTGRRHTERMLQKMNRGRDPRSPPGCT